MPGIYIEAVEMKAYVDVVCPYGRAVIQPLDPDTDAVTMASNSMLQGVEIDLSNCAAGATGIVIGELTNVIVEDVWITGGGDGDVGITDASVGTSVILRKLRVDSVPVGYQKTAAGTTWLADCRITTTIGTVAMTGAVADDSGVQTDETAAANSVAVNDMALLPDPVLLTDNDAYYFGGAFPFSDLRINIGQAGVKGLGAWTLNWEYWNGTAWAALAGVTDGTTEFTAAAGVHAVTFTVPNDWAVSTVIIAAYWIRARASATVVGAGMTQPLGTQSWITDGIDVDMNLGTLNLLDNELMGTGVGANMCVAAAVAVVNSYSNSAVGRGFRIGDNASAIVYSHEDNFTRVIHAGAGQMTCQEDVQTFYVYNGMKIADAITRIAAIGDAADTYRYLIHVFAGEYVEAVAMAQFVDLVGESNQTVVITQAAGTCIVCAANSRVKSVRCEVTAADNNDAITAPTTVYAFIEDVVVVVTHSANVNNCLASSGTGGFEVHDCVFQIDNVASYCLEVEGSGTHLVYDSELINTGAAAYAVFVGSADSISSFNNKLRSAEGWYLTSHANTQVLSYGDDFTTVAWDGVSGLFADLTGAKLYACAAGVAIGEWVYASANDTVVEAQANALATMPTIGRVVYKPSDTTCYVKNYGYAYDANANTGFGSLWVAGDTYWVSDVTAGQIITTMPGVWPQAAGIAVSTQRFKVLIGDNLGLVHCNEYDAIAETVMQGAFLTDVSVGDADYTAEANSAAVNDMFLLPTAVAGIAVGDMFYFGADFPFGEMRLVLGTSGVGYTVTWEYWNGVAWTTVVVTDPSTHFTAAPATYTLTLTPPADWAASAEGVGAGLPITAFWLRAVVDTAPGPYTQPLGTQCWTNAIGVGQWVYITTTDDHVGLARADAAATMPAIGVCVDQVDADTVLIKTDGKFSEAPVAPWGFTASDDVYVDPTTAGDPTNVEPVMDIVQKIAEVKFDDGTTTVYEIA